MYENIYIYENLIVCTFSLASLVLNLTEKDFLWISETIFFFESHSY